MRGNGLPEKGGHVLGACHQDICLRGFADVGARGLDLRVEVRGEGLRQFRCWLVGWALPCCGVELAETAERVRCAIIDTCTLSIAGGWQTI